MSNVELQFNTCPQTSHPVVRSEGAGSLGDAQVDNAYDFAGKTYDFYKNRFGRDSIDGAGLALKSAVRFCPLTTSPVPLGASTRTRIGTVSR